MNAKRLFLIVFICSLISCKNYYNEMIKWAGEVPKGISVDSVKKLQPDFIEIDWSHPRILGDENEYIITKIKYDYDILKMENYLLFKNNKYQGRFAHK